MRTKWTIDKRKYLDKSEVKKLLKTSNMEMKRGFKKKNYSVARNWFTVILGLYSGLRVSEMADLKNSDFLIYSSCAFIFVRKGKGNKKRMVRIGNELVKTFIDFTRFKEKINISVADEMAVICKNNATAYTTRSLQLAFKKCARKAGLEPHYSIHSLRHTYAVHLYKASNYNLRFVQEQLGHSSIRVTEVYANVILDDAEKALRRLYR